ncbi:MULTISPECIES: glycosyltransferase [Providencia]|uniref:glycosyltransferase n=1 Tax=Providencia TaxID=586 RepID=UPI0015EC2E32|nr:MULTISPECIES: glycosyltransferase [Providencia]QLQ65042.1 glycosyltransferase [Providencia rettgeri]URR21245.1 glycosyltransferase [Providencia rettgeri]WOB99668.1 glycosyltransferase [Providencia sp. PROV046]
MNNILLVIPTYYPAIKYGGPIFSTLNTSEEINKLNNIKLSVVTTNANKNERLDIITNQWIKINNTDIKYYNDSIIDKLSFPLMFNIWKDIKKNDIIHIQSIFNTPTPISLFYSRVLKKPIVLSPRGSLGDWCLSNGRGSFIKKAWINLLIKPFSNHITWHATSNQEKKEILTLFPNARIKIIPNGVDLNEYKKKPAIPYNQWKKKYNINEKDKIIISMGRIEKKKGFDILIKSFHNVISKKNNLTLLIAGPDHGEQKKLMELVKTLELTEKVHFVGMLSGDDKLCFLKYADVFVLPSYNENFGNVYLESLASGTPIIASKNTPWSEVEKNQCGLWVNNSIEETTQAIINILDSDLKFLSHNSIHFSNKYSWNQVAIEFKDLFNSMKGDNE